MKEQIQAVRAKTGTLQVSTTEYWPIKNLVVGIKQVILLLGVIVDFKHVSPTSSQADFYLWRKSQPQTMDDFSARSTEDPDVILHLKSQIAWATAVGSEEVIKTQCITFPEPFVLLRSPTMVTFSTIGGGKVGLNLFYKLANVSEKNLTELFIKHKG